MDRVCEAIHRGYQGTLSKPVWVAVFFAHGGRELCETSAALALSGGSLEEDTAVVFEDEPRMNTNRHEYRWASFGATTSWVEAHPGARASRPHTFWHSLGQLLRPGRPATAPGALLRPGRWRSRRQGGRVPHRRETERHATGVHAGETPALPGGRLFPSLLLLEGAALRPCHLRCPKPCHFQCPLTSRTFPVPLPPPSSVLQKSAALALSGGSLEEDTAVVFEDEPRMNTNRHEYQWASFGATTSWDEGPPGSAGVSPAHVLAQPRPTPPPGSTGSGARCSASAGPMAFPPAGWSGATSQGN